MRKTTAIILALALACVLPAAAGWEEGVAAFSKKDYNSAVAEFQQLAESQPNAYQNHYMLGLSLQKLGRKEEALNALNKAYDLNPNDLPTKLTLGQMYFSMRRYEEAAKLLDTLDAASLPQAQRASLYEMRGSAKLQVGNFGGAISDLKALARLKPSDPEAQRMYAAAALRVDNLDEAIEAYDRAVKADPSDLKGKIELTKALILKARGTQDKRQKQMTYLKASELAAAVAKAEPSFENLLRQMEAQLGAKQFDELIATSKKAAAENPRDWHVPYYVGQAYTTSGRFQEALQPLNQALELAGPQNQKTVWNQIGYAHQELKNYSEAISAYQNAGNQGAVARVQENQEIAAENQRIEAENERIRQLQEEAKRLEEQMKELEEGDGGGI